MFFLATTSFSASNQAQNTFSASGKEASLSQAGVVVL